MKKAAIVALFVAVAMGGAYAASLAVPFFADAAGAWNSSTNAPSGTTGSAGFIGIKNTTGSQLTVTVRYFNPGGTEISPTANTFVLVPQQGVSFRPASTDSGSEGTSAWALINQTSGNNGSATITWTPFTATTDVVGRYLEITTAGIRSAYTLPAGS